MFHNVLEGLCPQGWIPYEKCIPTAVLVCLRSHIGLIKASRKSIRKQPYSQYRCAVFTLEAPTVERWGWYHGCVCKGFQELAYFDNNWHHSPVVPIVEGSVVLLVVMGLGRGGYKTDVTPPTKHKLTSSCLNKEMWYYQCLQWNQDTLYEYICVCVSSNKSTN